MLTSIPVTLEDFDLDARIRAMRARARGPQAEPRCLERHEWELTEGWGTGLSTPIPDDEELHWAKPCSQLRLLDKSRPWLIKDNRGKLLVMVLPKLTSPTGTVSKANLGNVVFELIMRL